MNDRPNDRPNDRTNDPTAEALELSRTANTLSVACRTDRQFRTVRRALRRIGADVTNTGTYSLRAEFAGESEAYAVERLIQTGGALGVRNRGETAPETGLPVPPVEPVE